MVLNFNLKLPFIIRNRFRPCDKFRWCRETSRIEILDDAGIKKKSLVHVS